MCMHQTLIGTKINLLSVVGMAETTSYKTSLYIVCKVSAWLLENSSSSGCLYLLVAVAKMIADLAKS